MPISINNQNRRKEQANKFKSLPVANKLELLDKQNDLFKVLSTAGKKATTYEKRTR